jgi:hypothetical protein
MIFLIYSFPLYTLSFLDSLDRISFEARNGLKGVGDWFFYKYYTLIRVYGTTWTPHIFPYFFVDRILMREIKYQIMGSRVTTLLQTNNKRLWPIFPLHIGS